MLCEDCYLKRKKKIYEEDLRFKGTIQIDQITPKLYLGNNKGAKSKEDLRKLGITHILVVGYYLHEYYPEDFTYKTIEIEDNEKEKLLITSFHRLSSLIGRKSATFTAGQGCHGQVL